MEKSVRLTGIYRNVREIALKDGRRIRWDQLSSEAPPPIPYGSRMDILIMYEQRDYLNGTEGIVWATYDLKQAETVCSALLAQNIACEVQQRLLEDTPFYVLGIPEHGDVQVAIDFVWRDASGLRLKPDWSYPAGAENRSFEKWTEAV